MKTADRSRVPLRIAAALAVCASACFAQGPQRVKDTVHNLSVSGPGRLRASTETEVCIFCHTPHGSSPDVKPLWNRSVSASPYLIYQSSSMKAHPGQPTGSSKLCLSCHDGTVALGQVLSRPVPIAMATDDRIPPGTTNLGTDLTDDHPISFEYASSLAGGSPDMLPPDSIVPPVTLDKNGEVQCTSCHDAHDNSFGRFLVRSDDRSALCTSCHRPVAWSTCAHATSGTMVSGSAAQSLGIAPTAVGENACRSCHKSHGAAGRPWVLNAAGINASCLPCHDGSVATYSVRTEVAKLSNHGISPDPISAALPSGPYLDGDRITCADCHDPHAAGSSQGAPAGLPLSLARVAGVALNGAPLAVVQHEYELCFRCHGDSPARVDFLVSRQIVQPDKRLQFQPNNPSFHPVGNPGVNPNVPSLLPPLTTGSTIACADCHDADDSRRLGGSGPAGPHGSIFRPLLVRRYDTMDGSAESPAAYALCYRCHQRDSILQDVSFTKHHLHVVDVRAPCSVCHDPHGIYSGQGTLQTAAHLIDFDRAVVLPNALGKLEYVSLGAGHGQCSLSCHGKDHNPLGY